MEGEEGEVNRSKKPEKKTAKKKINVIMEHLAQKVTTLIEGVWQRLALGDIC